MSSTELRPKPKYQEESVLVVPRDVLEAVCPRAFGINAEEVRKAVLANYQFMGRNLAEHDPSFKQVIPYVVVRHGDEFLLIRRTKKQGEARLHDMYSLGIGGHINDEDLNAEGNKEDIIEAGMRRELVEEIGIEAEQSCQLAGIINDDSTEVARVHVGFVYLLTVGSQKFTITEEDKYTASWKKKEEILKRYNEMESWAQIVHDYLLCSGAAERVKKWESGKKSS